MFPYIFGLGIGFFPSFCLSFFFFWKVSLFPARKVPVLYPFIFTIFTPSLSSPSYYLFLTWKHFPQRSYSLLLELK